ncbi:amino acid ABC transporter permease [Allopusillimonas soli]|uniref:Amino acid ABC transporter permease n=1 Tax=Allopusillimonas soli TaxID=659016 RepID=A0A853FBF3_9BURK|nr:amino acid ABC transporter permease [Allopusillimonas soli]NYT35396.1 amino acid ABC transporter permease [Allopusillimonas soli]TEA75812.1 amino acid ABC transporter permease [Allopusillimonas soli]
MNLDFSVLLGREPMIIQGLFLTIKLTLVATLCGFCVGTFCAIGKRGSIAWLRRVCTCYVEAIRNTPLLVQIFLVYFGISNLGLSLNAVTVAMIALTINLGAYTAEIMRAGFDSIERGQLEAAETLGLSKRQIYWHVILKQALERVYPALASQFVLLMLASSICSQISAEELTAVANFIQSDTYRPLETYVVVGLLYVLLSLALRALLWLVGLALFTRRRKLGTLI